MNSISRENYLFNNKQLITLIVPIVLEQLLTLLVGMADTVMVSSVGEAAVSGVSLVDTVNLLIFDVFLALATGGAIVAGQYIGSGKMTQADKTADQLIVFMFAFSLVVMFSIYAGSSFILDTVFGSISPEVRANAFTYLMIVSSSIPFIAIYNSGAALFRAMGNSSISMKVSIIMNIINVGGNAILIYVLHCGVEGVAIPTAVSRIVAALIMLILLRNEKYPIHLSKPFKYKPNVDMIKKILYIGIPNSIENSMFQLGKILLLSLISSFGTMAIAANAVCNNLATIQCMPGLALNYAISTVISQCVGAGDYTQARYYIKKLTFISYGLIIVLNLAMFPFLHEITGLYALSTETANLAIEVLLLHGTFCCLIWPTAFNIPSALRASADVKFTLIISLITMWVVRIGMAFLLGKYFGMGLFGVWAAMVLDWAVRFVIYIIRVIGHEWEKKSLIA